MIAPSSPPRFSDFLLVSCSSGISRRKTSAASVHCCRPLRPHRRDSSLRMRLGMVTTDDPPPVLLPEVLLGDAAARCADGLPLYRGRTKWYVGVRHIVSSRSERGDRPSNRAAVTQSLDAAVATAFHLLLAALVRSRSQGTAAGTSPAVPMEEARRIAARPQMAGWHGCFALIAREMLAGSHH